jgi:hypothetical protein
MRSDESEDLQRGYYNRAYFHCNDIISVTSPFVKIDGLIKKKTHPQLIKPPTQGKKDAIRRANNFFEQFLEATFWHHDLTPDGQSRARSC